LVGQCVGVSIDDIADLNGLEADPEICGPLKALFQTADYQDIIKGLPANHISLLNRII